MRTADKRRSRDRAAPRSAPQRQRFRGRGPTSHLACGPARVILAAAAEKVFLPHFVDWRVRRRQAPRRRGVGQRRPTAWWTVALRPIYQSHTASLAAAPRSSELRTDLFSQVPGTHTHCLSPARLGPLAPWLAPCPTCAVRRGPPRPGQTPRLRLFRGTRKHCCFFFIARPATGRTERSVITPSPRPGASDLLETNEPESRPRPPDLSHRFVLSQSYGGRFHNNMQFF